MPRVQNLRRTNPKSDATLNIVALYPTGLILVLALEGTLEPEWLAWRGINGNLDFGGLGPAGTERSGRKTLGRKPAVGMSLLTGPQL